MHIYTQDPKQPITNVAVHMATEITDVIKRVAAQFQMIQNVLTILKKCNLTSPER